MHFFHIWYDLNIDYALTTLFAIYCIQIVVYIHLERERERTSIIGSFCNKEAYIY